jgi:hypothetical protein
LLVLCAIYINSVIPAQAGIQSLKKFPRNAGTKSNGIFDKTTGFRPAPE